jgi:hypothetical protein
MKSKMDQTASAVHETLQLPRLLSLGLDIWSNKGLSASFLGISAGFFHPTTRTPVHLFLNLFLIPHPHTGIMRAEKLRECLNEWNIDESRVLMFITDNGSNMIKAIKDLNKMNAQQRVSNEQNDDLDSDQDHVSTTSDTESEEDEEVNDGAELEDQEDEDQDDDGTTLSEP